MKPANRKNIVIFIIISSRKKLKFLNFFRICEIMYQAYFIRIYTEFFRKHIFYSMAYRNNSIRLIFNSILLFYKAKCCEYRSEFSFMMFTGSLYSNKFAVPVVRMYNIKMLFLNQFFQ